MAIIVAVIKWLCAHIQKVTLLHKCGHVNACVYIYMYIHPIGSMHEFYGNIYHQYTLKVSIYIYIPYMDAMGIYKYSSFCIDRLEKKRDRNLHISQHAYKAQSAQFEMNFKGKFSFEPCFVRWCPWRSYNHWPCPIFFNGRIRIIFMDWLVVWNHGIL